MIDLKDFTESAKKTESIPEKIYANEDILNLVVNIVVDATELLDQLKKNIYYGRDFDITRLKKDIDKINNSVNSLKNIDIEYLIENKEELKDNPRLLHAKLGIATEAGELLQSGDDDVNFAEEVGDIEWYAAIGLDELGIDFEDVMTIVIEKLKKRYADKFTTESANNRDLDSERTILNNVKK